MEPEHGVRYPLQAALLCMRALLARPGWAALVNLAGSELPRYTNIEFVRRGREAAGRPYVKAAWMPAYVYNKTVRHYFRLGDTRFQPNHTMVNQPVVDLTRTRPPAPYNLASAVIFSDPVKY